MNIAVTTRDVSQNQQKNCEGKDWYTDNSRCMIIRNYNLFGTYTNKLTNTCTFLFLSAFECQDSEYRCNNKRCITKSAENADCDGIDWCQDNSGCTVNWGLIGGLIGGIGSALLGLAIGLCLKCYYQGKTNQVMYVYIINTITQYFFQP